jgi:bifunctional ADP-heptose synthase (sugar kinase/adenylyltransferase)
MREAAELANLAGGRVVLKFGTAQITQEELLAAVTTEFNEPGKAVTSDEQNYE